MASAVVGVAVGVALLAGGCESGVECAGPEQESPHVAVNGAPWLATHHAATLRACLDGKCEPVTARAEQQDGLHLYTAAGGPQQTVTVTVVGRAAGHVVLNTAARARIRRHKLVTGPCGPVFESWAHLVVTASGKMTAS